MIIDYTKFTGKLTLPQTGNSDGLALVNEFIDTYEPEYLQNVLGYDLWKAFDEGTQGSGTPDQRWIDLLEGKEFDYCGTTLKLIGFNNAPIQNYVYYQFLDNEASNTTLTGGSTPASENAKRVNSIDKMVDAWNRMVTYNEILWKFLQKYEDVYPEWKKCTSELFRRKNSLDL